MALQAVHVNTDCVILEGRHHDISAPPSASELFGDVPQDPIDLTTLQPSTHDSRLKPI